MKKLLAFILTLVMVASTFTMLPLSVSADTATPELLTYSQDYAGQPAGNGTEADLKRYMKDNKQYCVFVRV